MERLEEEIKLETERGRDEIRSRRVEDGDHGGSAAVERRRDGG